MNSLESWDEYDRTLNAAPIPPPVVLASPRISTGGKVALAAGIVCVLLFGAGAAANWGVPGISPSATVQPTISPLPCLEADAVTDYIHAGLVSQRAAVSDLEDFDPEGAASNVREAASAWDHVAVITAAFPGLRTSAVVIAGELRSAASNLDALKLKQSAKDVRDASNGAKDFSRGIRSLRQQGTSIC